MGASVELVFFVARSGLRRFMSCLVVNKTHAASAKLSRFGVALVQSSAGVDMFFFRGLWADEKLVQTCVYFTRRLSMYDIYRTFPCA